MPRTADVGLGAAAVVNFNGAGTKYLIETPAGVLYQVYTEGASDVVFRKSMDRGLTWSNTTTIYTGTASQLAIWYDRWSNISAGLIHCAYSDTAVDDTFYRAVDTESGDALSTQTTIFLGVSTATGNYISITRAVGGNVYCQIQIDDGAEGGFYRLPTANVPNGAWAAARTNNESLATLDQSILLPDYDAADTQDILCIFWDASANEVSRKLHDDSGNSWGETSIATSMTALATTTAFPNFAVAMDIANTRHVLVAWSNTDAASARLGCWTVDSGAITAKTDVVASSTDDQGLCGISIDTVTGYWYVYYCGATAGGETWPTSMNVYYKVSTDSGTTWGPEMQLSRSAMSMTWMVACPRLYTSPHGVVVQCVESVQPHLRFIGAPLVQPRASHQMFGG